MIRLSQCMIVKNEEKNIEKALSWADGLAFEQIVTDTGSTDKTVELAEKLGAKISRFKWINDFSAAKNYALQQATGDWIAFLDADEYMSEKNAKRLSDLLEEIEADPKRAEKTHAITCMIVNINDSGNPMTRFSTVRIFRNLPDIRFTGKIHEQPTINPENVENADFIQIIHTGYSESARNETDKSKRNIDLLRSELKLNPDNISYKLYLANALSTSDNPNDQNEAEQIYLKIINGKHIKDVHSVLKVKMYIYMINKYITIPDKISDCKEMCHLALKEMPESIDFLYFLGLTLCKMGDYQEAWKVFKNCEEHLVSGDEDENSIMIPADPTILFGQMILTAKNLNDIESVILYSIHILTLDKTRVSVLGPCIATMLYYGASISDTTELLSNIYDMQDPEEIRFVAATAKDFGAAEFAAALINQAEETV